MRRPDQAKRCSYNDRTLHDTLRIGILDLWTKRLGFGDYHPVTSGEDMSTIPWETWIYTDVGGGIEITFTDEFGSGTYEYAPMPPNQGDISTSARPPG